MENTENPLYEHDIAIPSTGKTKFLHKFYCVVFVYREQEVFPRAISGS